MSALAATMAPPRSRRQSVHVLPPIVPQRFHPVSGQGLPGDGHRRGELLPLLDLPALPVRRDSHQQEGRDAAPSHPRALSGGLRGGDQGRRPARLRREIPGRLRQSALRRQGLRHGRPGHRAPGAEPGTDQPAAGEGVLHRRTRPPLLAAQPLPVPGYPEEHGRAEPPGIPEDPVGPLRSGREAETARAVRNRLCLPPAVQPQPTGSRRLRRRRPRRTAPGLPVLRRRFGRDALVGDLRPEGGRAERKTWSAEAASASR